jgi:hypothetical protein
MNSDQLHALVGRAGFIFRGRVVKHLASGAAAGVEGPAVTVAVDEVLRSTPVLKGLAGRDVTIFGEDAAHMREGARYIFLADCVVLGDHATLRDLGHLEASPDAARDIGEAIRIEDERPLRERVAGAELIVTGRVASSRQLERDAARRSEHDPDWWVARLAIRSVAKGKAGKEKETDVLFANSDDLGWYKSPKLHKGAEGIFLLRLPDPKHVPEAARKMYAATDPLDHLPVERMPEIERLLQSEEGDR